MSYDVITQAIGLIASALVILSFTQKSDKRFKIFIAVGACVFTLHFILLGAYAGAVVGAINASRTITSMRYHNSNKILVVFVLLYAFSAIYFFNDLVDLLPILSGAVSTVALFKLSGVKLRVAYLFTESGWLLYSIIIKSLGGLITNIFVLSTNVLTIYRLLKEKK